MPERGGLDCNCGIGNWRCGATRFSIEKIGVKRMSLNFRCAAVSYLNLYIEFDRPCSVALNKQPIDIDGSREQLLKLAKEYILIRSFRKDERPRMKLALDALLRFKRPSNNTDAVASVDKLADLLKEGYGQRLLSAASKFLWMRFKSPIVIYDSLGHQWLSREKGLRADAGYGAFCGAWRAAYRQYSTEVAEACRELGATKEIRQFTLAGEAINLGRLDDQEFDALVLKPWFQERVFDHAVISAPLM
jgi:hypothetical protein